MGPRATDNTGILLATLEPGALVGAYVIEARRPSRGIGHVYRARGGERAVTLTILPAAHMRPRSLLGDHYSAPPFGGAARPGGAGPCGPIEALNHPGIPRVLDSGVLEDRRPWIATEYISGRPLDIGERVALPQVAALVRDVADILDHAHVQGVVHRQLAPHVIVRGERVWVTDWNLAAAMPLAALPYLAPEQRDGDVSSPVDVFALGAIVRELIKPLKDLPPVLTALVRRMIARDPVERPTALEVRDHASWITDQLEPPPAPKRRPITSESATVISGEIHCRPQRRP